MMNLLAAIFLLIALCALTVGVSFSAGILCALAKGAFLIGYGLIMA